MFGWFKKRYETPIERRNYGGLYAGLSLLLFLGTLWAVADEINGRRPWKDFQEDFRAFKVRILNRQLADAKGGVSRDDLDSALKEIAHLDRELHSGEAKEAAAKVEDLNITIREVSRERANMKAEADNRNYMFEHSQKLGHPEAAEDYLKERKELEAGMAAYDKEIDSLVRLRADITDTKIKPIADRRKAAVNRRDSLFKQVAEIRKKITETKDAPVKVHQVMLADLDKSNFGRLQMRVDRCQSCHLGIGDPVMADTSIFTAWGPGELFKDEKQATRFRKVFGPHPKPELLKTHSVENFGCTNCHGGQANSVDDVEHAHGFQAHWERPLLTGAYVQASCRKCHEGNYSYPAMEKISQGRMLFIDMGCFGCHDGPSVPDWKEYKVGPSLENLAKKVSPEWAYKWIMNPNAWNEHTRMPNFEFTPEQTEAVVAYLYSVSKDSPYTPASSSIPAGDAVRGKKVMQDVGCIACHAGADFEGRGNFKFTANNDKNPLWANAAVTGHRVAEGNMYGPELTKVGSKVSAAWLYDWVRNPQHYNPKTRMPSLRLSDQEAADITAFLMGRQDPGFTAGVSLKHVNDPAWAEKGKGIIREYGCFGCHDIKGMEGEGKVSVPLSDFGRKTAADLFFGYLGFDDMMRTRKHFDTTGFKLGTVYQHTSIGEDWFVWTALKMKNSRIFATDAIPQKMPVFNMTDEEAYALTVLLRSYSKEFIPAHLTSSGGVYKASVDDGRFMTHWHNCVGCHKIEEHGGFIQENLQKITGMKGADVLPYSPPSLNTAGMKLQEEWFYEFINNPASHPVRDWLTIRMPTYKFRPTEISRLDKYFLGLDKKTLGFTDYSFYPASDASIAAGRELFTRLKCQQCHAVGSSPANGGSTAVPAPNLAMAGSRLNPEWIPNWIRDPQYVVPGTKMPNFFGTRDNQTSPYPDILGGDWQAQVNALRDYVWRIGGPKGVGPDVPLILQAAQAPTDTTAAPAAAPEKSADRSVKGSSAGRKLSMR